jgi:uncharacterized protein YbjT (DUF2867 family)
MRQEPSAATGSNAAASRELILLTGGTGYVGGRLLEKLEARGLSVRCLARRLEDLVGRVAPTTEVVGGDVLDPSSLVGALRGARCAYYLIHSMGASGDFEQQDREGARNFALAAAAAGLERIVYLGGLGAAAARLSPHLASRQEVGAILRSTGVPVIELRAAIVVGSGSLSFEMVRALVERLPVMITPRWVEARTQPIAIGDLLDYLVAAREVPLAANRVFEIGGADVVSYGDLMREYARQRGLRRWMIRVPVLTPRLSSLWLGLVTPLYARVGRKLIESIRHDTVVHDSAALGDFAVRPVGVAAAIAAALRNEDREIARTRWCDAVSAARNSASKDERRFGNRIVDARTVRSSASRAAAFAPIRRIGGARGWYACTWLWHVRGFLDLLVGGVGVRRGRRDPEHVRVGDPLDFWRVEGYEPDRRLRLRAEMKVPGRAWLEFEVLDAPNGGSEIRQTALFDPSGLGGLCYWYALLPLHVYIFRRMLQQIARRAEQESPSD